MRDTIRTSFVEYIPSELEQGVLYISRKYSTASHLCCCGCGLKVVTPLSPAKWQMQERNGAVSLRPSIGNWGFPCRSHYWIQSNRVLWAGDLTDEQVRAVKHRDARALDEYIRSDPAKQEKVPPSTGDRSPSIFEWLKGLIFGKR